VVKGRLAGMDPALTEAARDLGATPKRALWDITLPLIRPGIVSGMFLALAMSLDDFLISFFVSGADSTTLPLKIYSSARYGVSSQINALCTVMLLFVFLLVIISQLVLKKKQG
jgi:spermidine/putrescine transport system permease protein